MIRNYTDLFRRVLTAVILQHEFKEQNKRVVDVVCNDSNNPVSVRDAGELVIQVVFDLNGIPGYHNVTFYHNFLDEVGYSIRRHQVMELIGRDAVRLIEHYNPKSYLDKLEYKDGVH